MTIVTAKFLDAWNDRGLTWTLKSTDGKAILTAEWYRCEKPLSVKFTLDDAPFVAAIPLLRSIGPNQLCVMDDAPSQTLSVAIDDDVIGCEIQGAFWWVDKRPEIKEFDAVFRLLETIVFSYLPSEVPRYGKDG